MDLNTNKITSIPEDIEKKYRSYLFFLSGQAFSIFGSSIVQFAVIVWITIETQSVLFLSISTFLTVLPQIIATPIAGVYADLWDRKKVIGISDFLQASTTIGLILIFNFMGSNIWLIILMNSLRSIFHTFHFPTTLAIIPVMVPEDKLTRVNGINMFSSSMTRVIAPLIAAALIALIPIEIILWIDIITFIIALIPLLLIDIPSVKETQENNQEKEEKPNFFFEFKQGFKTIKSTPVLIILGIWSMINNFFFIPFSILMPYFIIITLNGNESILAIVTALLNFGMIIGGLISSIKKKWRKKATLIMLSGVLIELLIFISAFSPQGIFTLIFIAQFIIGLMLAIGITLYDTLIQSNVPKDKLGRIYSIDNFISTIIYPIGVIVSGPLAEFFGIRLLLIFASVLCIIINIFLLLATRLKINENEDNERKKIN